MKWSVIICTHNRVEDLRETLKAVSQLVYAEGELEILVVDNASQDETRQTVMDAAAGMPQLKYLREDKLGLSHARNTGIANAAGEFVAFLDDDAAPIPAWLEKLEKCFRNPRVACVGGRVKPVWRTLTGWPDWLHPRLIGYFTVIDHDDFREFGYPNCPAGTNVAFRKAVFDEVGAFDPNLGRTGTSLLSNEEADLCVAIAQAGYRILYTPEAVVHHKVHENRLTREWVLDRSYWGGVSSAIMERRRFGAGNRVHKTLKYLALIMASESLKRILSLTDDRKKTFFWECQALFSRAFLKTLWLGHGQGNGKGKS
jgi:GT2 family glycosyltransferase